MPQASNAKRWKARREGETCEPPAPPTPPPSPSSAACRARWSASPKGQRSYNLKAGVTKPCRYEPTVNATYREMAGHYGVAVVPTRVRKPRDKAKVEVGVQVVERWV